MADRNKFSRRCVRQKYAAKVVGAKTLSKQDLRWNLSEMVRKKRLNDQRNIQKIIKAEIDFVGDNSFDFSIPGVKLDCSGVHLATVDGLVARAVIINRDSNGFVRAVCIR